MLPIVLITGFTLNLNQVVTQGISFSEKQVDHHDLNNPNDIPDHVRIPKFIFL